MAKQPPKDKKPAAAKAPAKADPKAAAGKEEKPGVVSTIKHAVEAVQHAAQDAKKVVTEAAKNAAKTVGLAAPSGQQGEPKAEASQPSQTAGSVHSFRRRMIGRVTSDKMDKTVVVEVSRYSRDRMYKKYVKERSRYKAHDEKNEYKVGDRVEIQEHRPISREKRWLVVRLVSRPVLELQGAISHDSDASDPGCR